MDTFACQSAAVEKKTTQAFSYCLYFFSNSILLRGDELRICLFMLRENLNNAGIYIVSIMIFFIDI